jgi:DNA polymerase III sliding clamp (beta) subunit (PCNA family)
MKVSEFKRALELVKPGLASSDKLMEQGTSVIFVGGRVQTFNDEVSISAPLATDVEGAVLASPIYAFLSKLPADSELEVEQGESELKLLCGRQRAGVLMEKDIKLPLDEELSEPGSWQPIPGDFLSSLRSVLFSSARSGTNPILACVNIGDGFIETCDEYRMTRCSLIDSPLPEDMSSGSTIKIVARHLGKLESYEPERMGYSGNWAHFDCKDGIRYCVRIVDGDYPDLGGFLELDGVEIEFPKELDEALDWASVVADDAVQFAQEVKVELSRGKLIIRGEGPDGWAEDTLCMRYTGEPVTFSAHPLFLKEMVKIARKVILGREAIKIETDGMQHVVALGSSE